MQAMATVPIMYEELHDSVKTVIVAAGELSNSITLDEVKARHTITMPIHEHQMIILTTKSVATITSEASPQIMMQQTNTHLPEENHSFDLKSSMAAPAFFLGKHFALSPDLTITSMSRNVPVYVPAGDNTGAESARFRSLGQRLPREHSPVTTGATKQLSLS